jgi:broad specificity phosphatase PhoE
MKTRIFLVRHGETVWNRENRCQGFTDIELSEKGLAQAEAVATYLKKISELHAIYSSDLKRARKTAEAIAGKQGLEVVVDPRLRELNQGEFEGQQLQITLKDRPEVLEKWYKEPAHFQMPGGESLTMLQARAWPAFAEIIERHQGQTSALVAHNLAITVILCKILNLDLNHFRRIKQSSAALNEIVWEPYGPVIMRLNDTHFLDEII